MLQPLKISFSTLLIYPEREENNPAVSAESSLSQENVDTEKERERETERARERERETVGQRKEEGVKMEGERERWKKLQHE